ncbi:serine/threonine-protein kinase CBK1-like [Vespa crabro]|uniref:serine/threonine-protein kinase CBK1-like n=1 Tax=Vespa crabro TaxID=7445 RepID=UPI001F025277|nr:serine/threonine-protein kinase CBK1-like [Vespa crabro]
MSIMSSVPCSGLTAQEGIPEWDQNNTTTLIQMYKERKCLWDTSHEFYKNRRFRREALTEMANHFNCSLADVEKKLYMLRSSFRKEYRRWNYAKLNAGPNNTFLVRKPQWFALDLLMFLKDDVAKKSVIPLNPVTTDCVQQQQIQQNHYHHHQQQQQQQQLHQHQQSQQEAHQQTQRDLDLSIPEIQNVFYYDSENSTLTPLEPGEVTLDYNLQCPIQVPELKQSPGKTLKRSSNVESNLLELNNKRQKNKDPEDTRLRLIKASPIDVQEKDTFTAFGNFVAEELRNIKDTGQMQLAKLRIHQILFDATRNFLKVPIPRL